MEENIKINLLNKDNLAEKNYSTISILRLRERSTKNTIRDYEQKEKEIKTKISVFKINKFIKLGNILNLASNYWFD
jgi:hypothetical protein